MKTNTLSKSGDAIETYHDNGVFLDGRAKAMKYAGRDTVRDFGYEAPSGAVAEGVYFTGKYACQTRVREKEYDEEGNLVDDGAGPFAPGFTVPQAYADKCGINIDGTSKDDKMRVYKKDDNSGDTEDIVELTKEDRKKQDDLISYLFTGKYPGMEEKGGGDKGQQKKDSHGSTENVVPFLVRKNPKK